MACQSHRLGWTRPATSSWQYLRRGANAAPSTCPYARGCRVSASGALRQQLRHELLDAGVHLLLIEILVSENKAREALSKFRAVKARTPRVLAVMRQIADGVAAKRPRDAPGCTRRSPTLT